MVGISSICCVGTRRVGTSCAAVLTLLQGCTSGAEPPPQPPPDPTLDVVVEGMQVRVNGHALDATRVTKTEVAEAFRGLNPDTAAGNYSSLGMEFRFEDGRLRSLEAMFTPYGLSKEREMDAFAGRLIVNGAWIHRDAELYHIEKELAEPCLDGGQGAGRFDDSPFADSWTCEVAGQPYSYWLKRYPNAEHPLFAFEIEFHETPFPPQAARPELHGWDLVTLPWYMLKAGFEFLADLFDGNPSATPGSPPSAAPPANEVTNLPPVATSRTSARPSTAGE